MKLLAKLLSTEIDPSTFQLKTLKLEVRSTATLTGDFRAMCENEIQLELTETPKPKATSKLCWIYTDDRGERYRIADDVILETIRDNEFFHPTSGNRVFDFRTNLTLE